MLVSHENIFSLIWTLTDGFRRGVGSSRRITGFWIIEVAGYGKCEDLEKGALILLQRTRKRTKSSVI